MDTYKEIRSLKTGRKRVPLATRRSLEEPLLSAGHVGEGETPRLGSQPSGDIPGGPATSPFFNTRASGRTGAALWGVARGRLGDVRGLEAVAEDGAAQPEEVESLGDDGRRKSIVEKLLFSLANPTFKVSQQYEAMQSGDLDEIRAAMEPKWVGAWAPLSDARHLSHMIRSSILNVLLLAIPIGTYAGLTGLSPSLVFWANFIALLPLALILGEITEDLAVRFGDVIGGLLNATFGNVVEMILGLAALSKGLYKVVAASLIGSILSNLLLVMGGCFLFGGFKHKQQRFNTLANKVSSSLLFLSSISIIIPTAAKGVYGSKVITPETLVKLSHAIAILLVAMYVCYLYFQLKTHAYALGSPSQAQLPTDASSLDVRAAEEEAAALEDEDDHVPHLSLSGALFSLTLVTITVAICSEFLTGALEEVSKSSGINEAFLGLIVLPIAGNAAEHITAVFVAVKNKMDLAISVALGSSIQIATFVLPVTVLAGWAMGKELTLDFDPFAVLMMTVSVILAYFVSSDGSSNWLLGLQLVVTYILIGSVYLLEKEGGDDAGGAPGEAGVAAVVGATVGL